MRSRLLFWGFLTVVVWPPGAASAAPVPSVYSHFSIVPQDEARSNDRVDPEHVVASVHVVRPIAQLGDPAVLHGSGWRANRLQAEEQRRFFRELAEKQYRLHGVLPKEGELPPRVKKDLDQLVEGQNAIIAITDPQDPGKLLQMISIAYGKPLPLDETLRGLVPPTEPLPHQYRPSEVRFVESFGTLWEIPVMSAMMSARPAVEGDTVEIKTFIKGYRSHADWIPTILRLLVSLDLVRSGTTPLTAAERALRPGPVPPDRLEETVARLRPYYSARETDENLRWRVENYVRQPNFQKTLRVSRIRVEVIGEALVHLYVGSYGLKDSGVSATHPELGETVHVLEQDREALESFIVDHIRRPGVAYVHRYGYLPSAAPDSATGQEGACLSEFSQLGQELPAVLGTRGTQFPFRI